jgi:hypothetical protein
MGLKFARRGERERGLPPTLIRRIKNLVVQGIMGAEYGSPLALLKLGGMVSEREYEAAIWYRQLDREYRAVIGVRGCKSQPLGEASRAAPPDPDSERGQLVAKREAWTMREYPRIRLAMAAAGADAVRCFDAVVLDDATPEGYAQRLAVAKVADLIHKARHVQKRRAR